MKRKKIKQERFKSLNAFSKALAQEVQERYNLNSVSFRQLNNDINDAIQRAIKSDCITRSNKEIEEYRAQLADQIDKDRIDREAQIIGASRMVEPQPVNKRKSPSTFKEPKIMERAEVLELAALREQMLEYDKSDYKGRVMTIEMRRKVSRLKELEGLLASKPPAGHSITDID